MTKLSLVLTLVASLAATGIVKADDPCSNATHDEYAKQAAHRLDEILKKSGWDAKATPSNSSVEACNPGALAVVAGQPGRLGFAAPVSRCGLWVTFTDAKQPKKFAKWIFKNKQTESGSIVLTMGDAAYYVPICTGPYKHIHVGQPMPPRPPTHPVHVGQPMPPR